MTDEHTPTQLYDDPYEPVCDTCRGDGIVRVYTGRAGQQTQPCPDCVMRGVTK